MSKWLDITFRHFFWSKADDRFRPQPASRWPKDVYKRQGSYCPTGSHNPTSHTCDFGFHCPTGSPQPQPCIAGYYTNATGQSVCQKCPIGMYCLPLTWRQGIPQNESVTYKPCPRGFYCPEQTGSNYIPCPAGTYSNETGLYDVIQCKSCDPGQYCSGDLRTKTDGPCHTLVVERNTMMLYPGW